MTNRWRALRALIAQPPELFARVGFNGLAQLAPVVVVLAITPLLLDRLGLDRFGIWSVALVVLSTLRLLDGGIAASMMRFYAIHAAEDERVEAGRLLVGSLLFLTVVGAVLTAVMFPLAPSIAGTLDIPAGLEGEATVVLRWVPGLAALALMSESTSGLLIGHGRFRSLAATMWTSAGAFALAVVVLVQPGAHLEALMVATAVRFGTLVGANLLFAAGHVSIRWPLLPSSATAKEIGRYSSWMQLSAVTGFANVQLDGLIIAAFLPVRYVGLYQIGMQVASAVRSLPLFAFPPLLTRLTTTFRLQGRDETVTEFGTLERRWLPAVLGYGVAATAAVGFAVPVWLGDRYALAGVVAAVLLAGYTVHVGLTGMRTCYVRAVGNPALETRCSTAWTVVNLALTVPLVLLFGVVGVVTATAVAGTVASVYFVVLCRNREGLPSIVPGRRLWLPAAAAVALTVAGELAIVYTGFHGFLALALAGVPALAGWAIVAMALQQAPGTTAPAVPGRSPVAGSAGD
ncbi:MAG TPA: oligosaccharide flippase family protein [Solirubrobacterales bacterium]|nr:oligosaccharide flippase family protein [Solirubrobacterales bacterium]